MGILAQNDALSRNQAALKSNRAQAQEGYLGYGVNAPSPSQQPFKIGNTQYNNIDHFTAQFDKMPKAQKVALYNSLGSSASKSQLAKAIYDHLNSQGRSQAPKQENGWQQAGNVLKGIGNFGESLVNDAIVQPVKTVGNAFASGINYAANEINGNHAKTQQQIMDNLIAGNAKLRAANNYVMTNQAKAQLTREGQAQLNIAKNLQAQQLANTNDVRKNNDPIKVGAAGLTLLTDVMMPELKIAKGVAALRPGIFGKIAGGAAEGTTVGSVLGGTNVAMNEGVQTNLNDLKSGALQGAATGGMLGGAGGFVAGKIGDILKKGAQARLDAAHTAKVMPDLTPEEIRSMTPQKVAIDGATDHGTEIGVSTPKKTQVGVKDVSSTHNVQVRTVQPMTPQEYHTEFNKINQSYERSTKYLHTLPPTQQRIMQEAIDKRHQTMLQKLDDNYHSSQTQVPEGTSKVTKLTQSTTKAPKNVTTGGKPAGYVNSGADKLKTKATPKTTPTAAPKSFAPLDKTTQTKVSELKAKSDAQPVAAGKTRLYQTNDGASGKSDQYFKNPDHLSNYINGRADNATLSYKDVPSERVQSTPGKPTVFRINGESNATADGTRVSGGATKAEIRAIQNELTDHFDEKATYNGLSYKTETAKAVKLVQEDPKKAMDIAMNHISGDNAVHEVAVAKAVEQKALREGDVETLRKLATSDRHTQTSEAAQRLGTEGYKTNEYDPVNNIRKVMQDRQAAAEKRIGNVKQAVAKETSKMKVKAPSKDDWNMFIESIKC